MTLDLEGQGWRDWRIFVMRWMGLSLVFHLIASWYSLGHHSVDEYFQILEFLNFKRGLTPERDLAVEFHERMRPWLQPFLYGLMLRAWEAIGVHNPFTWAWSFRLVTGLLGWGATVGLALRSRQWFTDPRARRFCVMALALIWFFPALHARPSSESLGGSAFLMALVLLTSLRPSSWRALVGGALMGLSFEARFQMGFMIAGLFAWLAFFGPRDADARLPIRRLGAVIGGFAFVFVIGRWVDHWGYGEWVLSPWRYVEYNLLRGEVNRYGRSPVWDVFRMSFTESWPFLGLALALASLIAWIRHPRHPLTWSQVPFFLVHEAIAHKELRFFFPIALAGPVLLTMALTSSRTGKFTDPERAFPGWPGFAIRWGWRFLLLNDGVALLALLFMPFSRPVQFYKQVWDFIPEGTRRFEIFYRDSDPYHLLGNPVYFYRPDALVTTPFTQYAELLPKIRAHETVWLFNPGFELPVESAPVAPFCQPAIRTFPTWIAHLDFNGWLGRAHVWTVFECKENR
jgi:phosphatidylinositol glycan class B